MSQPVVKLDSLDRQTGEEIETTLQPGVTHRRGPGDEWTLSPDGLGATVTLQRSRTPSDELESIMMHLKDGSRFEADEYYDANVYYQDEDQGSTRTAEGQEYYSLQYQTRVDGFLQIHPFTMRAGDTKESGSISLRATEEGVKLAKTDTLYKPTTTITDHRTLQPGETHDLGGGQALWLKSAADEPG
ncbi:uncharacterized protein I303_102542 [Kwoniella dejecticola CBS 10117]|uniref:Uncharacterized protein n=1 Tax=Kwoniella dejecticola CBS 10117 TaxID=1296121 RepID=A0A1A6A916_9TREE|nr:uncharacterized protein I303_02556 [Kwoniella dejecticola CBS 10117]OBR86548.1 hypothetical protein I303_02556 [Kwoniella dejecticola CBS 10117]